MPDLTSAEMTMAEECLAFEKALDCLDTQIRSFENAIKDHPVFGEVGGEYSSARVHTVVMRRSVAEIKATLLRYGHDHGLVAWLPCEV